MKKFVFSLIAVGITAAVCLTASEWIVKLLFSRAMGLFPRYVTDARYGDFAIRRNLPDARYHHTSADGRWEYRINSQGFRGEKTYDYEKTPGTVRILTLGDSFTMGFEVQQNETYSVQLEKKLKEKGIQAEVINSGVSGFSNAEELVFLEQEGVRYRPDFVILGFFYNDLDDNLRADLYRYRDGKLILNKKEYLPAIGIRNKLQRYKMYRWLSENSYLFNYFNVIATVLVKQKMHGQNIQEIEAYAGANLQSYQIKLAEALLKRIHETASKNGAQFILMDIPEPSGKASLPEGIQAKGLADFFVDGREMLKNSGFEGPFYWPFGQHHWTGQAHEAAAAYLADLIASQTSSAAS